MDKNRLLTKIQNRKIFLPKKGTAKLVRFILNLEAKKAKAEYIYHFDTKNYKNKQVILLSDHASRNVFYYTLSGYPFVNFNVVVGFHNIFKKILYTLLLNSGVILKSLYEPDLKSAKEMKKVIKMGGSLCFFPEGIQSTSGSTHPMNPSTIKFLKSCGVEVLLCKSYGAYLANPRYSSEIKKGHQEFHYEVLFTSDELHNKSEEELYNKYLERFRFNDFEWNKDKHYEYYGKESNTKGIDTILYRCPKCGSEFEMYVEGADIICSKCNNRITVSPSYELIPSIGSECRFNNIDEWYKEQRRIAHEEVLEPNFSVSYEADYRKLHFDKLVKEQEYKIGEGLVTIDKNGIRYQGTKNGENVDILYDIKKLPSFVFTPGFDNDFYYDGEYILLKPKKDSLRVVKYMIYIEELHNLVDPVWDKVSKDVYEE